MHIATVHGRIIDAKSKKAVRGAEIWAGLLEGCLPVVRADTKTDGQGRYQIDLAWEGKKSLPLLVDARARGYRLCLWPWWVLPQEEWTAQTTLLSRNARKEVNLELHPGFSLQITVSDHKGRPVQGVVGEVICTSSEGGYCYWPLSSNLTSDVPPTSDRKGKLTIHGFSSETRTGERNVVSLKHPDFPEYLLQRPEDLPRTRGLARTEVRLAKGLTDLSGRVTGPKGQPLEGVNVQCLYRDNSGLVPCCHSVEKSALTDGDGSYRIRAIAPGTYLVSASGDRWVSAAKTQEVPRSGKTLDFRLEAGVTVSGTVLDEKGMPASKATIEACWQCPDFTRKTVETDRNGRFALSGLPKGAKTKLTAHGPSDQIFGYQTLKARDRETLFDARECCLLSGRLTDAKGKTIRQGVTVQAYSRQDYSFLGHAGAAGADGAFRITIPPGKVIVTLSAGQKFYALLRADLAPGEVRDRLELTAKEACGLNVQVLDENGAPIAKASVDLNTAEVWRRGFRRETQEDGTVPFDKMIPPGRASVRVIAPGFQTASKKICLPRKTAAVFRMKAV